MPLNQRRHKGEGTKAPSFPSRRAAEARPSGFIAHAPSGDGAAPRTRQPKAPSLPCSDRRSPEAAESTADQNHTDFNFFCSVSARRPGDRALWGSNEDTARPCHHVLASGGGPGRADNCPGRSRVTAGRCISICCPVAGSALLPGERCFTCCR